MKSNPISFRTLLLLVLALPLVLTGCELFGGDDDDDDPPARITTGVIVGNGGNFGDQNGFITVYDPATGTTANLTDAGAFLNSLAIQGDIVYAAMNTFSTGRIDVYDLTTNARVGQIQDVPTPRFIAFVNEQKAYATNLVFGGNGTVSVLNLQTNEVVGDPIEVGAIPEGIVVVGGKAFVANNGSGGVGTTLSVINTSTDRVVSSVALGCDGPKDLLVDGEDEIVVVCQGKTVYNDDFSQIIDQTNGQIVFVNAETETVIARIPLDIQVGSTNGTQAAAFSAEAEEAYVIAGSANQIFRINTDENTLEATLDVPPADGLLALSGVAYDAATEHLYIGRFPQSSQDNPFPDFTAAGSVVVLDRNGATVNTFVAGAAISHIVLRQEAQ